MNKPWEVVIPMQATLADVQLAAARALYEAMERDGALTKHEFECMGDFSNCAKERCYSCPLRNENNCKRCKYIKLLWPEGR